MDKKGRIQEHSKFKLELYRLYLGLYLTVLLNSKAYNTLYVHDIFAGKGKTGEDSGSALLAAIEIERARKDFPGTNVALRLNEKNPKSFKELSKVLEAYKDFCSIFNKTADEYIKEWVVPSGSHNLFFIDPHGYTQVSSENLKKLFTTPHCDFLIFIPIYHIFRFLKPTELGNEEEDDYSLFAGLEIEAPEKQEIDREKYYEPIAKFLSGLGIEKDDAEGTSSVEEFAEVIVGALKEISGSEFVYSQMIKKTGQNSKYCLFYITQHILGAEKFLEAKSRLKEKVKKSEQQQTFGFDAPEEGDSIILGFVEFERLYDNVSLYELGIQLGLVPSELNSEILRLEKGGGVEIKALAGQVRNRSGLYISYKNFKAKDRRIGLIFKRPNRLF